MQYQGMQKNLNQKWAGRILSTRSMADEFRNDFWAFAFAEGRSYCRNESQCHELVEMMMNDFAGEYSRNPLPRDIYSEMIVKLGLLYGKTGGKEKRSSSIRGQNNTGYMYNGTGRSGYAPSGNTYSAQSDAPYGRRSGGYDGGRAPVGYQSTSYREPTGYRPENYGQHDQRTYAGGEAWRAPFQERSSTNTYTSFSSAPAGTGFEPEMGNSNSRGYGYGNPPVQPSGYTQNPYAEPTGTFRQMPSQPEVPPTAPRAPGGWYTGNAYSSQSGSTPPVDPVPGPTGENRQSQPVEPIGAPVQSTIPAAPQVSGIPVQSVPQSSVSQTTGIPEQPVQMPGVQTGQPMQMSGAQSGQVTGNGQPVQMPGIQTNQPMQMSGVQSSQPIQMPGAQTAVYTAPVQPAMPVGTIPMSTTVSVQPVMQIPVQPVMQAPVQPQTTIPNLAGVQDILGMKGGADTPEAQEMLVQAARLIQAYNAATKSNVGELEEEESEEENEIVEADPSKAASWRPPKFGFSRKEKKAEKTSTPADPKKKKQKEEPAKKKVEVPDAKPENNTTRKQEKEDDGKSPAFSIINTILLILTGASVLFLIWETGLIQKLL